MIDNFKRIVKEDFNMSVKISAFEIENVKRVKAVAYEPTENGLTVLGGKN